MCAMNNNTVMDRMILQCSGVCRNPGVTEHVQTVCSGLSIPPTQKPGNDASILLLVVVLQCILTYPNCHGHLVNQNVWLSEKVWITEIDVHVTQRY